MKRTILQVILTLNNHLATINYLKKLLKNTSSYCKELQKDKMTFDKGDYISK